MPRGNTKSDSRYRCALRQERGRAISPLPSACFADIRRRIRRHVRLGGASVGSFGLARAFLHHNSLDRAAGLPRSRTDSRPAPPRARHWQPFAKPSGADVAPELGRTHGGMVGKLRNPRRDHRRAGPGGLGAGRVLLTPGPSHGGRLRSPASLYLGPSHIDLNGGRLSRIGAIRGAKFHCAAPVRRNCLWCNGTALQGNDTLARQRGCETSRGKVLSASPPAAPLVHGEPFSECRPGTGPLTNVIHSNTLRAKSDSARLSEAGGTVHEIDDQDSHRGLPLGGLNHGDSVRPPPD